MATNKKMSSEELEKQADALLAAADAAERRPRRRGGRAGCRVRQEARPEKGGQGP